MITPALLALSFALLQDSVHTADSVQHGKLVAAGLETIVLEDALGNQKNLPTNQVLDIYLGAKLATLMQGEEFLAALDFQNASASFGTAAEENGPFWIAPWAKLRRAEALLAWCDVDPGRAGEAEGAFREWIATWPDSWWVIRARKGWGIATALTGNVDGGATLLQELTDFAYEKNLGRHVELGARLTRCEIFLHGEQAPIAETRLRDLVPTIEEAAAARGVGLALRRHLQSLLTTSQIRLGEAIELKDGTLTAAAYWNSLLGSTSSSTDAKAAAWTGIARHAKTENRLREAQFTLARIPATLNAGPEVLARALYELGEVCEQLGDNPASSTDYFKRVIEKYPRSRWAIEAQRKLGS
ncbi:MAG TPA: hypothetical protein DDW23_06970 [Planctomycetes bacterium]|nr:hypothetical protein [Planctomycetota bacterium]